MKEYFEILEKKIRQKINIEDLEIINNSYKHKNHKFFSKDKYHLHIKIKSTYLKSLSKIHAQRLVMNILKDELKTKIHALEISIF